MASKYIQKFPIPGSFPDILHDFVREVLRDQPENIHEYGAAYFTALDQVSYILTLPPQGIKMSSESLVVFAVTWTTRLSQTWNSPSVASSYISLVCN